MHIWRKRTEKESSGRGVARAALNGATREQLLLVAQHSLAKEGKSGRIGVWLEADSNAGPRKDVAAAFHGIVWDRGSADSPPDWAQLSVEPPLPEEMLLRGTTVEQDLEAFPPNPIIGLLVGVRHALWVPIERKEQLRGVILAGSLGKEPAISREHVESVAAELAMAVGLEEEQRNARMRNADLGVIRRYLAKEAGDGFAEAQLARVVESCTQTPVNADGPGATFAAIGELRNDGGPSGQSFDVEFRWHSGAELWSSALGSEPLASLWRRALQERRVIGSDSDMSWTHGSVDRIVAFPLESEGQRVGALVAGLPGSAVSLATYDRLELRAILAARALHKRGRKAEEMQRARQQQTLLECVSAPLLLLDETGRIMAASRGAHQLISVHSEANG